MDDKPCRSGAFVVRAGRDQVQCCPLRAQTFGEVGRLREREANLRAGCAVSPPFRHRLGEFRRHRGSGSIAELIGTPPPNVPRREKSAVAPAPEPELTQAEKEVSLVRPVFSATGEEYKSAVLHRRFAPGGLPR
jgi:hypothetical protein